MPKFSILLPTKNRLRLLRYAVETVRRQSYSNWEIVVSDNASEDDIAGYVRSLCDDRVRYVRSDKPLPVTDNWNLALDNSTGEYVIMLGDDDGLLRGYLADMAGYIEKFSEPELLLTDAILFAYPHVYPNRPSGFLQIAYGVFFEGKDKPYVLGRKEALEAVRAALSFQVAFQFNMQYSVISRRLIERSRQRGPYFQSPYPDFYASNANLLTAEKVVIIPRPMVCIGISPQSYGYYYFNDKKSEGAKFLDNIGESESWNRVREHILPGNDLFSCWLAAVETVRANHPDSTPSDAEALEVEYARYRAIQLWHAGKAGDYEALKVIYSRAQGRERLLFRVAGAALLMLHHLPKNRITGRLSSFIDRFLSPYPNRDTRIKDVPAQNMLDVFDSVSPQYY